MYPLIDRTCSRVTPSPELPSCTNQLLPPTWLINTITWWLRTAAILGAGEVRENFLVQLEAKLSSAWMAPNKYRDASQPQNACGHPAGLPPTTLPLASITLVIPAWSALAWPEQPRSLQTIWAWIIPARGWCVCRCFALAVVVIAIKRNTGTKIVDIFNNETSKCLGGVLPQDHFLHYPSTFRLLDCKAWSHSHRQWPRQSNPQSNLTK